MTVETLDIVQSEIRDAVGQMVHIEEQIAPKREEMRPIGQRTGTLNEAEAAVRQGIIDREAAITRLASPVGRRAARLAQDSLEQIRIARIRMTAEMAACNFDR